MAVTIDQITPAQLTASAATYYTAPTNERVLCKTLTFWNGGSATAVNQVTKARALAAGETLDLISVIGVQTLLPGGTIQALADVTLKVSIAGSVARIS